MVTNHNFFFEVTNLLLTYYLNYIAACKFVNKFTLNIF